MEPMNPVIAGIAQTINHATDMAVDASIRTFKLHGEIAAISTVLQALIASHPDPDRLWRAWQTALADAAERGQQAIEDGARIRAEVQRDALARYNGKIEAAAGHAQT